MAEGTCLTLPYVVITTTNRLQTSATASGESWNRWVRWFHFQFHFFKRKLLKVAKYYAAQKKNPLKPQK